MTLPNFPHEPKQHQFWKSSIVHLHILLVYKISKILTKPQLSVNLFPSIIHWYMSLTVLFKFLFRQILCCSGTKLCNHVSLAIGYLVTSKSVINLSLRAMLLKRPIFESNFQSQFSSRLSHTTCAPLTTN